MCGKNSQFSGYSADMWAAGICLFIFTTGKVPFFSMAPLTLFEMIAKAEVPYDQHPNMSSTLKELLQKMLTKNPADRAGVGYCLQHDFCKNARTERIKQLGKDFDRSDHDIVLSNEEVDGVSTNCILCHWFNIKLLTLFQLPRLSL
jgi:serine/threonine protein kinase